MMLYADDISQFSNAMWHFQSQINTLQKFCKFSGMQVNVGKTQITVFRTCGIVQSNERWFLNAQQVEVVSYCKYFSHLKLLNWKLNSCQKVYNMLLAYCYWHIVHICYWHIVKQGKITGFYMLKIYYSDTDLGMLFNTKKLGTKDNFYIYTKKD